MKNYLLIILTIFYTTAIQSSQNERIINHQGCEDFLNEIFHQEARPWLEQPECLITVDHNTLNAFLKKWIKDKKCDPFFVSPKSPTSLFTIVHDKIFILTEKELRTPDENKALRNYLTIHNRIIEFSNTHQVEQAFAHIKQRKIQKELAQAMVDNQ